MQIENVLKRESLNPALSLLSYCQWREISCAVVMVMVGSKPRRLLPLTNKMIG